jgi:putative glutamine amidotransferase
MSVHPPVVGLVADFRLLPPHLFHVVGNKYVVAAASAAKTLPLIIPALAESSDFEAILALVDGLLFTGSPSNVAPDIYGSTLPGEHLADQLDHERDATTLPLIREAIKRGIPVLGLCRGFQEINVAMGGTLHQEVHEVPGFFDHRENEDDELDKQYAPSHPVTFTGGGLLAALTGLSDTLVNSLHGQGVDRLAPGLSVEAIAPDGLVEAFRVTDAKGFALAVQWHPEWRFEVNPVSIAIFEAFGDACRSFKAQKARAQAVIDPPTADRAQTRRMEAQ